MRSPVTLLIPRMLIRQVFSMRDCIDAVERAFRAQADGAVWPPRITGTQVEGGGFHVKTCGLRSPAVYAAKINANFPGNPSRYGLPTVQGVVALFDAERGTLTALLDSGEITRLRTAAASAVAARYLAREDARSVTICGCGVQGRAHLEALGCVRPIELAFAYDANPDVAARFATDMSASLGITVRTCASLPAATLESDIVAMCTSSRRPLLRPDDVHPGTFVAAVGADSEDKQELDARLLAPEVAAVVVDDLQQCLAIGELHHAVNAGVLEATQVRGDLASVVAGRVRGRVDDTEITVFDSTGTALEDVAAASLVYERVAAAGLAGSIQLGE